MLNFLVIVLFTRKLKILVLFCYSILKDFLFIALAAILFNRAEQCGQFWLRVTEGTVMNNFFQNPSTASEGEIV